MVLLHQQRLVGSLLLLSVISSLAYFLMSNASKVDPSSVQLSAILETESFNSSIEIIPTDKIEIIPEPKIEILADPQNLSPQLSHEVEAEKQSLPVIVSAETSTDSMQLWFLQIASFSVEENALAIQKKVIALGYDAKVEATNTNTKIIYRVRIGPKSNKLSLEKISLTLNKKLKIKSQVMRKK